MHCTRPDLKATLDSLIALQDANWGNSERALWGYHFDKSLEGRIRRGQYLGHPTLDAAYQRFLEAYRAVPGPYAMMICCHSTCWSHRRAPAL